MCARTAELVLSLCLVNLNATVRLATPDRIVLLCLLTTVPALIVTMGFVLAINKMQPISANVSLDFQEIIVIKVRIQ